MNIRDELFAKQDLKYREFNRRLIPNVSQERIIGVRVPEIRRIAKKTTKENADFELYYVEEAMTKGLIIGFSKCSIEEHLDALKNFIPYIDNWAVCDTCCAGFKFAADYQQAVWSFILPYLNKSEFEARFAIVMMMDYFINDEYIDKVLEKLKCIKTEAYYVNMASAWALSVAFVKYPNKVMPIFEEKILPVWVHNKAIQKCRESYRVDKSTKDYLNSLKIK